MQKILIFTGAGASQPLGLPTTQEFNEAISESELTITGIAKTHLGDYKGDIERLLSTLEDLERNIDLAQLIVSKFPNEVSRFNTGNLANHTFQLRDSNALNQILNHISKMKEESTIEIKRIKGIVYEKLKHFKNIESINLYKNLISEIKNTCKPCSICYCTANYDLTLDNALINDPEFYESIGIENFDYGFTQDKHSRSVYNPKLANDWSTDTLEYIKVHGSLDWARNTLTNQTVKLSSTPQPKHPEEMVILYPGFKGTPKEEPFISLHEKLEKRLKEADIVIIIGFAFRDPYINILFESEIRSNPKKKFFLYNPIKDDEIPPDSLIKELKKNKNFKHIQKYLKNTENPLNIKQEILTTHKKMLLEESH